MGPLAGLAVLEVGDGIAAAFCGRLLAGFGATVVKVEPPQGDPSRRARVVDGAPEPGPEAAPLFAYLGMGKRSLVASSDDALARVGSFDVLLTGDRPIAYGAVHEALVHTEISAFGGSGPYRDWPAENITVFGAGGQMALTGEADREPLCTAGNQGWYQTGLAAFAATCLAILERERSGLGQRVEIAAMEVMAGALEGFGPTSRSTGAPTPRTGARRLSLMGIYPVKDGFAGIFAMPRQFSILAPLLNDEKLPEQLRLASAEELVKRFAELEQILEAWFSAHTREEVRAVGRRTRLPLAPVASLPEVVASEHLAARDFWARLPLAGREITVPGPLVRMSGTPWESVPPPALGEMALAELDAMPPVVGPVPEHRPAQAPPAAPGLFSRAGPSRPVPLHRLARGPLQGLRVLDFTAYWLGPYCAKWLADFGADVIKVESPRRPDFVRTIVADRTAERWWDRSSYFNNYNRGKRSLALDPTHEDGRRLLLELVKRCDVVVENFPAGYMDSIGLGYDSLRGARPDVIMLSASGYGVGGPDSSLAGVGTNMEQLSGIAWLNGYPDSDLVYNSGIAYADPNGGNAATAAVLMALLHRGRTGRGQFIDLSAHEVLVSLIGEQLAALSLGFVPRPTGNRHPDMVPHGCYPCDGDDRWVTIALRDETAWPKLAALIGRAEMSALALDDRRREEYEIDVAITSWTVVRQDRDAAEQLRSIGVAAAPVFTTNDLADDPHLRARGYYQTVDDPDQGAWPHDGIAWRLERTPGAIQGPAPRFGQQTREILSALLGLDDGEIRRLYEAGAAADAPTR